MNNILAIKIKGSDWRVRYITHKQFHKYHLDRDESEGAITDTATKIIDFKKDSIDLRIVRHELFHAHFAECATGDSDLSNIQIEEQACNLVGNHLDDIVSLTNAIIDYYLKEVK